MAELSLNQRIQHQDLLTYWHNRAPVCRTLGMLLSYNDKGEAIIDLPYNPRLDHGLGGMHGGIISTLLDNAGWFTVAPHFNDWMSTVELHVRFLDHLEKCDVRATGKLVRVGKKISVAEMELKRPDGSLAATGSATFTLTSVNRPNNLEKIDKLIQPYAEFFK